MFVCGGKHISRTSNRPLATGKILRSTCKACSGSDRKGSQQRAKVTSTVTAIFTSENSLHGGQTGGRGGNHTHAHPHRHKMAHIHINMVIQLTATDTIKNNNYIFEHNKKQYVPIN